MHQMIQKYQQPGTMSACNRRGEMGGGLAVRMTWSFLKAKQSLGPGVPTKF